jgi:DNA-binding transcriptional regulator GbsR (MarR family)
MPDIEQLSPDVQSFVERIGLYFEQYGLPRIGGRITGLLLVAHRPLSLDDIAAALSVSRASVSTNVRLCITFGFAERVSLPGDRRDYCQFPEHGWERMLHINIEAVKALRALAERGLDAVTPDDAVVHDRLEEMLEFVDVVLDDSYAMLERWRSRRQERRKKRA